MNEEQLFAVLCWLVRYEISFRALDTAIAHVVANPRLAAEVVDGALGDAVRELVAREKFKPHTEEEP